jgi:hypothetical protein
MKVEYLIGIIVLLVVILLFIVKYSKEGFTTNEEQHDDHTLKMQKKYNNVAVALAATKNNGKSNIGGLGTDSRSIFGSIQDTMDEADNAKQYVDDPFPLEAGISGMAEIIGKCEEVNTATDCSAFDNPEFGATCGLCIADPSDMGTNSEGKPWMGGLVLTAKEREQYRTENRDRGGNFLAAYNPTVGSCPAGRFVTTKAECKRVKDELDCKRGGAFGTPPHCSQCFSDSSYHIVDPNQPGIIIGSGTLVMVGSGILTVTQGSNIDGPIYLGTEALTVNLSGSEFDPIVLSLEKAPVAKPYDAAKVYRVNDLIKYRGKVYKMVEAAGNGENAKGYNPDRAGDKLWDMILDDERRYVPPPNPYIAGYLESPNGSEFRGMDLYRIILKDRLTGRKPRVVQQLTVNGIDVSKMGTGFGQVKMVLDAKSPFTFVDTYSQEASLCPNSPFITNPLSATLLNSDPCYARGQNTPGKYNLECLQQVFLNNGCGTAAGTLDRSGYPSTAAKGVALMTDLSGRNLTVDEIANKVYQAAISTASGLDARGNNFATLSQWSDISKFCTGVAINSPCETVDESGKLTNECISYLWDNKGEYKTAGLAAGPTYSLASLARSLFSPSDSDPPGKIDRFCTRAGTRAPKNKDNMVNPDNMDYWKNQGSGSVADVKKAMSQLHKNANDSLTSENTRSRAPNDYIQQCYGITPNERPTGFSTKYTGAPRLNTLVQGTVLKDDITLPENFDYTLSFDITPYGRISNNYGGIVRVSSSATGNSFPPAYGERNPMILFDGNSTIPYIVFGDHGTAWQDWNWWGSGDLPSHYPALPINEKSSISIRTSGKTVVVTVAGVTKTYTQPAKRMYSRTPQEKYTFFASDNNFPAANAMIENIVYTVNGTTILQTPPAPPQSTGPGQSFGLT